MPKHFMAGLKNIVIKYEELIFFKKRSCIKTSKAKRLLITLLLGFSSGLPLALSATTLQVWFVVSGVPLETVGFLGLAGTPYLFKFLWAPLMDQWTLPLIGRLGKRRSWILSCQLLLCFTFVVMSFLQPRIHFNIIFCLASLIAFLSASQDVVVDAYRTEMLSEEEYPLGASFGMNGYRLANLISSGFVLVVAQWYGWQYAYLMLIGFMGLGILGTLIAPTTEQALFFEPCDRSVWTVMMLSLSDIFKRSKAPIILLFIVTYKLGEAFSGTLSQAFLIREIDFSLSNVGFLVKTMGLLGTLASVFLGFWILPKFGCFKVLWVFGILQAMATLSYLILLYAGKNYFVMAFILFLENVGNALNAVAFSNGLMNLCNQPYTAFQYALFSALTTTARIFISPFAGMVAQRGGWMVYFWIGFLLWLPGLLCLYHLKNVKHYFSVKQH